MLCEMMNCLKLEYEDYNKKIPELHKKQNEVCCKKKYCRIVILYFNNFRLMYKLDPLKRNLIHCQRWKQKWKSPFGIQ